MNTQEYANEIIERELSKFREKGVKTVPTFSKLRVSTRKQDMLESSSAYALECAKK